MHKILFVAVSLALFSLTTAQAGDWVGLGQMVRYGNLVDQPDLDIQYIAFKPGVATLMLQRRRGITLTERVQIDLNKGESHHVFVKRECTNYKCIAFVVTFKWDRDAAWEPGKIDLDYEVKIIATPSS